MKPMISTFRNDNSGAIAIIAAAALPLMVMAVGISIDYVRIVNHRIGLQAAADAAALAGAKSLSMSDASRDNVSAIVSAVVAQYATENASGLRGTRMRVRAETLSNPLEVKVVVKQSLRSSFAQILGQSKTRLRVSATARVIGQPNICVLALERSGVGAISMIQNSRIVGNNCSIYSNSTSAHGLAVQEGANMIAHSVCSAGGVLSNDNNISPVPVTDCPQIEDPLAGRPEPAIGDCDYKDTLIDGGMTTLSPGVYCGGLRISGTSNVQLKPGNYLIKDGRLSISQTATVTGAGVSFFLGPKTWMFVGTRTTINLSASKDGVLAGLLIFGSRAQSKLLTHTILSRNAQNLVGTIYLPNNNFIVDGDASVGGDSAYTAIVARRVVLLNGPHLVLNTDYGLTDVPVPQGIKGVAQPIVLVE